MAAVISTSCLTERQFNKLVKAAKVKPVTFHGMRHTVATLMLQAGEPVNVVAKRLGHTKIQTTLETYAHVLEEQHEQAAATMDAILYA
jgi:integrase